MVAIMFVGFLFFLPKYNLHCQNRKQELNRRSARNKSIFCYLFFAGFNWKIVFQSHLFLDPRQELAVMDPSPDHCCSRCKNVLFLDWQLESRY